jgi:hypothetical protein
MVGAIVVGLEGDSGATADVGVVTDGDEGTAAGGTEWSHAARTKAIDARRLTGLCMARFLALFG